MPLPDRTACVALVFAALVGCTWQPVAGPVKPELVMTGQLRVEGQLDWEARHVLVRESLGETARFHLVKTESLTHCTLPEGQPILRPLRAAGLRRAGLPEVLIPLRRREGETDQLYMVDENCQLRGPYGELGRDPEIAALRADGRQVALIRDTENTLRLLDPWTETTQVIAERVNGFTGVLRAEAGPLANAPEALWLLEDGKLTQRAYDGTLLVSMGDDVQQLVQTLSASQNALRIAFRDGDSVYEAVSPGYEPVRIAKDACDPEYVGTALDIRTPCESRQLVRIEDGKVRFFPPGVERVLSQGELTLQLGTKDGEPAAWVARDGDFRIKLEPTPLQPITALDADRIAALTDDGRVGVWSLTSGFTPALSDVRQLWYFQRYGTWLALHDVNEAGVGRLVSFTEPALNRTVQQGVPLQTTLLAEGAPVDGFRSYAAPGISEPIVLSYEEARVQEEEPRFRGTLVARALSGKIGSLIDHDVSSFTLVVAPQPGVLYAVTEGPRSGLWFAAL